MDDSFKAKFERFKERERQRIMSSNSFQDYISKEELRDLMEHLDFESTMLNLGIEVRQSKPHEWRGLCPDHVKYKGVPSSDPNWFINDETGLSYCFTEARGSNIVEIAKNIWGLETMREAYDKLMDGRSYQIKLHFDQDVPEENRESDDERLKKSLEDVEQFFESCKLNDQSLKYFEKDGITRDTLDKFGVVSVDYGRYKDRVLIPFLGENLDLIGYIAIDMLGKEKWSESHAKYRYGIDKSIPYEELKEMFTKKYRKTLYAPGFQSRNHIYGFYENLDFLKNKPKRLMIVEGERDCLKMMQEEIPCISVHGTYIKNEQLMQLKSSGVLSNLDEIYLGFDMDDAGDVATEKAMNVLSTEIDFNKIFVLNFPCDKNGEKRDPKKFNGDEILKLMSFSKKNNVHSRR